MNTIECICNTISIGFSSLSEPVQSILAIRFFRISIRKGVAQARSPLRCINLQLLTGQSRYRGIDFALDVIEAALQAYPIADHRSRVEHCCYVTPPILERLKRLGVIDSSATGFMYSLGDAYRVNRGEAAMDHMWPHRTLIAAGVPADCNDHWAASTKSCGPAT